MNNVVARNKKQITIGLDLGDRRHTYCVLDEAGKIAREGSLGNTREQLAAMARSYPGATVVMEAGTHSPWVSRFLQELGLRAVVANPRKTRAIYENERKSDRRDAMMLARLARMDPTLLHPIEHGSQEAQQDMLQLKLRDNLVRGLWGVAGCPRRGPRRRMARKRQGCGGNLGSAQGGSVPPTRCRSSEKGLPNTIYQETFDEKKYANENRSW
jgi:hypothetical protein